MAAAMVAQQPGTQHAALGGARLPAPAPRAVAAARPRCVQVSARKLDKRSVKKARPPPPPPPGHRPARVSQDESSDQWHTKYAIQLMSSGVSASAVWWLSRSLLLVAKAAVPCQRSIHIGEGAAASACTAARLHGCKESPQLVCSCRFVWNGGG